MKTNEFQSLLWRIKLAQDAATDEIRNARKALDNRDIETAIECETHAARSLSLSAQWLRELSESCEAIV